MGWACGQMVKWGEQINRWVDELWSNVSGKWADGQMGRWAERLENVNLSTPKQN
jgi:hypothetical protein